MKATKIAWVLSYVQGGVAKIWKDNLLDELSKEESEIKMVEELFKKIRNEFREMGEEERKVEQLRTIEQRGRTYDKYIQKFKKIARESKYKGQPLIEEFKRELNREIRRKLTEAESPPSLIEEWQERSVRLDRNQRQSRAEKRMLGRNMVCLLENAQQRGRFGGGLYREKGEQIMQKTEAQNFRKEYQNRRNQYRGTETGLGPIVVDRGERREGYQICFNCGGFGYMTWDYRSKKQKVGEERRINQRDELSKENRGQ